MPRRKLIQTVGVASMGALAGCGFGGNDQNGNDGNGQNGDSPTPNLGERVPEPLIIDMVTGLGAATRVSELVDPIARDNIQEGLQIEVEVGPKDIGTLLEQVINDERQQHFFSGWQSARPQRLDPGWISRYMIHWAGANGRGNLINSHSCEFSELVWAQGQVTDEETRRNLVYEAQNSYSNDFSFLPIVDMLTTGASNTQNVEIQGVGEAGLVLINPNWAIKSSAIDGEFWRSTVEPGTIARKNWQTTTRSSAALLWANYIYSPLTAYDENLDLINVLLEERWVDENGEVRIGGELSDGTFHNGDQITSSDVKFTYEHLWENTDSFPLASPPDEYSIEIIDDQSFEFVFSEPQPTLIPQQWPQWGIVNEEAYRNGGAPDDPAGYEPDQVIGSGPYQVNEFNAGSSMSLTPHSDHPEFSPSSDLELTVVENETTAVEQFLAGEVDVLPNISVSSATRIEENMPEANLHEVTGFMPFLLFPQHSNPPVNFPEFRKAVSYVMDRQSMNEVAFSGKASESMNSNIFGASHPYYAPDELQADSAPSPSGDSQAARQVLRDAGWGWDNNGNLRYPADADTSPPWPEGSVPQPEEFTCLGAENEFESSRSLDEILADI